MIKNTRAELDQHKVHLQENHVKGLSVEGRDSLIITMRQVDGKWVVVSKYCDDIWWLNPTTTNIMKAECKLDFSSIPTHFRDVSKAIVYRYMRRGRNGGKRPGTAQLYKFVVSIRIFFKYLDSLGISNLSKVTPLLCTNYASTHKARSGKPLAPASLFSRLYAVEAMFELSQYTDTPIPQHPWPDSSAIYLSGCSKNGDTPRKTLLIPDKDFSIIFKAAWDILQGADRIITLRDDLMLISSHNSSSKYSAGKYKKNKRLQELGFDGGLIELRKSLSDIRTAAYIVIASVSGCRNHELAFLRSNAYYSSENDNGERFWWMRSKSTKTYEGNAEWMVPEAAITALKIMEKWAAPYQSELRLEIKRLRENDPHDPSISEAEAHLDALFVGEDYQKGKIVRTLTVTPWNDKLREFGRRHGLDFDLASHQFRRKFANYAARSKFGDLRYLKEHFKHWSMNMTLGYALNESQEMALYLEIEDELSDLKEKVVANWLDRSTTLSGGYGKNIMDWRSRDESIVLFKDHAHMVRSIAQSTAIRSNGHAWCTADDDLCVGNTIEKTRCAANCGNAVIGSRHAAIYQGLYDHLLTLRNSDDIGNGGRARVQRDLDRCADVIQVLGYSVAETPS